MLSLHHDYKTLQLGLHRYKTSKRSRAHKLGDAGTTGRELVLTKPGLGRSPGPDRCPPRSLRWDLDMQAQGVKISNEYVKGIRKGHTHPIPQQIT